MRLEWRTCIRAGITVVVVWLAITYWSTLTNWLGNALGAGMPLVIGAGLAYVANILMRFYERLFLPRSKSKAVEKARRPVCLTLAFATAAVMIYFLVRMVLPELWSCITMLLEKLPGALTQLFSWLEERFGISKYLSSLGLSANFDWQTAINRAINLVLTGVGGVMGAAVSVVTTLSSTVVTLVLALVFAAYLLSSKEQIGKTIHRIVRVYAGEEIERKAFYVLQTMDESFHHFIVSQCTEALILGSLCILGMLLFQFPYAVMIGTLVGFTALIPIAGAYFAGAVGAFMIFTIDPTKALLFVLFLVILQQLEGNLIYPRVVGSSINLPPIWVLAAVTIGGGVMGVVGMLLGVPLAAAIFCIVSRDMLARERGVTIFDIEPGEENEVK